jgi:hypothetical protein
MRIIAGSCFLALSVATALAQEKGVRRWINDPLKTPDLKEFVETFEAESREVFVDSRRA